MSKKDFDKLVGFIEHDIANLFKGIETDEPKLKELLDLIRVARPLISTDFIGFGVLLRKYCFKNFNTEGLTSELKRIELIEKIFYTNYKLDYFTKIILSPFLEKSLPEPGKLIYFLYIAIFERLLKKPEGIIRKILQNLLNEWGITMKRLKMKISLIFCIPIHAEIGDYDISERITLCSRIPHIKIDETIDDPMNLVKFGGYTTRFHNYKNNFVNPITRYNIFPIKSYLVFNTRIPFKLETYDMELLGKERPEIQEVNKFIRRKMRNIINIFYLFGFDFNFGEYTIKHPWWFEFDIEQLDKYIPNTEYYNEITDQNIKDLATLYENVERSGILYDKDFEIINYRYHQIYNRDYLPDLILDAFIILEILFTRKIQTSIKHNLSENLALFISADSEECKQNYKLLKELYSLRSTIVHGGNWEKKIDTLIEKKIFPKRKSIKTIILTIVNRVIKKLILLKQNDPEILLKFKDKNYFLRLGDKY